MMLTLRSATEFSPKFRRVSDELSLRLINLALTARRNEGLHTYPIHRLYKHVEFSAGRFCHTTIARQRTSARRRGNFQRRDQSFNAVRLALHAAGV